MTNAFAGGGVINTNMAVTAVTGNFPLCTVTACQPLYNIAADAKSCEPQQRACTQADAVLNLVNPLNALSYKGQVLAADTSACLIDTCAVGYQKSLDEKSCTAKLCSELSQGELSSLGFNTNNGVISGTYNSCMLTCNSNFELASDGKSCLPVTYQPSYSAFSACSAVPCDGTGTQTATITSCQKLVGGQPVAGGQISDCSSFDQITSQSCQSPSGTLVEQITGGTKSYFCEAGSTNAGITPILTCDEGYDENLIDLSCTLIPVARELVQLPDIFASGSDAPSLLTPMNNILYFNASITGFPGGAKMWSYNPSTNTNVQLPETRATLADAPSNLLNFNGTLYYVSTNPASFRKLYKYNPSVGTPVQVPETRTDGSDLPMSLTPLNNKLYYTSIDPAGLRRLFVYNPDINTNTLITIHSSGVENPTSLTALGNNLFFLANNSSGAIKLHRYNEQTQTVTTLPQHNGTTTSDSITDLTALDNSLYYISTAAGVSNLYRYNIITSQRTVVATNPNGNFIGFVSGRMNAFNGELYFVQTSSVPSGGNFVNVSKIYKFNPGTGTTIPLFNSLIPADSSEDPQDFYFYQNHLYYSAAFYSNRNVYKYNPANNTTIRVSNFASNTTSLPRNIIGIGNELFFTAVPVAFSGQRKLFKYDIPSNVVEQIPEVFPNGNDNPRELVEMNGDLYLIMNKATSTVKIFKYGD